MTKASLAFRSSLMEKEFVFSPCSLGQLLVLLVVDTSMLLYWENGGIKSMIRDILHLGFCIHPNKVHITNQLILVWRVIYVYALINSEHRSLLSRWNDGALQVKVPITLWHRAKSQGGIVFQFKFYRPIISDPIKLPSRDNLLPGGAWMNRGPVRTSNFCTL